MTTSFDVLIDSSFLFALNSPTDKNRAKALSVARAPIKNYIIPDIVLAETAHMLRQRIGQPAVLNFLDVLVKSTMQLESVTKSDLSRAREIMMNYAASDFDLADCCIFAQAERFNISYVCTFDERDFRQFRPKHRAFLFLLPADLLKE